MKAIKGLFSNIRPGLNLPNDSQCSSCGFFDTSRQDVVDILWEEQQRDPKRAPSISQARCKCGDEARPRYAE